MASYSRNCNRCGKRINLRKMPGGQWVAFEGYDSPHDCNVSSAVRQPTSPPHQATSGTDNDERTVYDDLEFPEVQVGEATGVTPQPRSTRRHTSQPTPASARVSRPADTANVPVSSARKSKIPSWVWWVGIGLLVVLYWANR